MTPVLTTSCADEKQSMYIFNVYEGRLKIERDNDRSWSRRTRPQSTRMHSAHSYENESLMTHAWASWTWASSVHSFTVENSGRLNSLSWDRRWRAYFISQTSSSIIINHQSLDHHRGRGESASQGCLLFPFFGSRTLAGPVVWRCPARNYSFSDIPLIKVSNKTFFFS